MMPQSRKIRTSVLAMVLITAGFLVACSGQQFGLEPAASDFSQQITYSKQVDILFVVDSSSSMESRQAKLAGLVDEFIALLESSGLDYQIAVTTMDMSSKGEQGRFLAQVGTSRILVKGQPQLAALLKGRIQVGGNGSPVERGSEAMMSAIAQPDFLRPNSLLNVVMLSDEEDKSDSTLDYAKKLDSIRPPLPYGDRSWILHFMGVLPGDPYCKTSEWNFSSPGMHYIELANSSAGTTGSICNPNFVDALKNVRARVLEVVTEYPLDRLPKTESIVVTVNGANVQQGDINGWTYYTPANSIRFHGTAIPAAGAKIHVAFDPQGPK